MKTIKIGAEGVSVFLGDGLADYDIDADIADYLSTDTPAQVLPGETVGNLVDGKIYRLRRGGAELARPDRRDLAARITRTSRSGGRWRPISWVARRRRSRSGRRSGSSTRRWDLPRLRAARAAPLASGVLSSAAGRLRGADWLELSVFFNGDGTLNMDELGPDAVGLLYRGRRARSGARDRRRPRRANPLNNAHRTKSFTALKATAASAGLVGFEDAGFVFTVRDIVVEVNTGSPVLPGQVAPTIDWAGFVPARSDVPGDRVGYEVETGDPDNPVLIDFRGTPLVGFAAAHVVLEIGDNVFVSGAFSFRMGEVETVTVEQGGLLPDITGLQCEDDQDRRRGCECVPR